MDTTLFVAMSHTLTHQQEHEFRAIYGTKVSWRDTKYGTTETTDAASAADPGVVTGNVAEVILLSRELQAQLSQVPATATLKEIQDLAKAIVAEAVTSGATHFLCTGEPTLTMWANLYAGGRAESKGEVRSLVCIQSTTERKSVETTQPDGSVVKTAIFSHVQWREMF